MKNTTFLQRAFSKQLSDYIIKSNETVVTDSTKTINEYTDFLGSIIYGLVEGVISEEEITNIFESIKNINFKKLIKIWTEGDTYDEGEIVFYGNNLWESLIENNLVVPNAPEWRSKIELTSTTIEDLSIFALKSTKITAVGPGITGGGDLNNDLSLSLDFEYLDQKFSGEDKNFEFSQNIPSSIWTINHTLNKKPSILVVDSAGTTVEGSVTIVDNNTVKITFSGSFSGTAILN